MRASELPLGNRNIRLLKIVSNRDMPRRYCSGAQLRNLDGARVYRGTYVCRGADVHLRPVMRALFLRWPPHRSVRCLVVAVVSLESIPRGDPRRTRQMREAQQLAEHGGAAVC